MLALFACSDGPPPAPPLPAHREFPTLEAALSHVVGPDVRLVGVGELHANTNGPKVTTTLARFTRALPALAPRTTDLVIETWRLDGKCGRVEEAVATQVEQDMNRPEATKDEIVLLAEAAVALGVQPHDLAISCEEYASVLGPGGEVAYDAMLRLLTTKLGDYATRGLDTPGASLVLYGGAVHNDVTPREGLEAWSYGPAARAKAGAAYVEVDLYVPEIVRGMSSMIEDSWAPLLDRAGPDRVIAHERSPGSWVILLEST